jgi:hypothetical protein
MARVGFVVLVAGVVGPQAAAGSTAAHLAFVLPVAEPASAGAVGHQLLVWVLAGALCIPAVLRLLWVEAQIDDLCSLEADLMGTAARRGRPTGAILGPAVSGWRSWPARGDGATGRRTPRRPIRG